VPDPDLIGRSAGRLAALVLAFAGVVLITGPW